MKKIICSLGLVLFFSSQATFAAGGFPLEVCSLNTSEGGLLSVVFITTDTDNVVNASFSYQADISNRRKNQSLGVVEKVAVANDQANNSRIFQSDVLTLRMNLTSAGDAPFSPSEKWCTGSLSVNSAAKVKGYGGQESLSLQNQKIYCLCP